MVATISEQPFTVANIPAAPDLTLTPRCFPSECHLRRAITRPMSCNPTNELSLEDWRDWVMHVSDNQSDEIFVLVLGKLN